MGKSLFIVNEQRQRTMRMQFRKLREQLPQRLQLEGPCSDEGGHLIRIVEHVRQRIEDRNEHPVSATLATLRPQNIPGSEESWLKQPFLLGVSNLPCHNAGAIANSEPIKERNRTFRSTGIEELTLLTLAVLRNLGINSSYSFLHYDETNPNIVAGRLLGSVFNAEIVGISTPCILIPEIEPTIILLVPPYVITKPGQLITGLEVLDDDALLSLFKLKAAAMNARALMGDICERSAEFEGEGSIRAMSIGHELFDGSNLWSLEEADASIQMTREFFRRKIEIESIRKLAEKQRHKITCMGCHAREAASRILCKDAKTAGVSVLSELSSELIDIPEIERRINGIVHSHGCIRSLIAYLNLAFTMNQHVHPSKECPERKGLN